MVGKYRFDGLNSVKSGNCKLLKEHFLYKNGGID